MAEPAHELEPQVTLPWLVRLRWLAACGQALAILLARFVFELDLRWWALVCVTSFTLLSNVVLFAIAQRTPKEAAPSGVTGAVLAIDTVSLTLLLAASGGPMNPFTVLYLVQITLSAVVLSARWTTAVAVLSVLGFGLLFLAPQDPRALHGAASLSHHLHGMWVAFVLATGLTAFFVRRIAEAIRHQREAIAHLREENARQARLASLTTLAAGAAHELGSPLGTIAVAAHEAARAAGRLPNTDAVLSDLRLIELEVERCRAILAQMGARAAELPEQQPRLSVAELAARLRAEFHGTLGDRVAIRVQDDSAAALAPSSELTRAVAALVQNALDATTTEPIAVEFGAEANGLRIVVENRGPGIPPEILRRIGEPFFTTKQPGKGLGLGVFLARACVESEGGGLTIESSPVGTRAVLSVPAPPRARAS
jgi:two-component system, sensor histidine kinase RegB